MIKEIDGVRYIDIGINYETQEPIFAEIEENAFSWLEGYELGYKIWNNKYRYKNETFTQWLDRVSNGNKEIQELIKARKFLFGGRCLSNRGTKQGSVSNCYSIGFVPDSMEDILDYGKMIGLTYKSQGGQGLSLSHIRPRGTQIGETYESDGIVPFMEIFNIITSSISQGGSRKGALMISMDVWHKQIEDFITIKSNEGKIEKANLSVEIDDEFMKCIEEYRNTGEEKIIHLSRDYENHHIEYDVNPVALFKKICEYAKNTAEPGIIFTNKFRNYNLMEFCDDYQIETCNPCGEQPLPKHGSCLLSSINLGEYVSEPYTDKARFDFETYEKDLKVIVREMDVLSGENVKLHPLKEQQDMATKYRNMGIGYMGWADMLVQLNVKYGSQEHIDYVEKIAKFTLAKAIEFSAELGKELGSFPAYTSKVWDAEIIKNTLDKETYERLKKQDTLRNCALLSVAPTGSIATMLNVSGGVEPFFSISFKRRSVSLEKGGKEEFYDVYVREAERYLKNHDKLTENFVTAHDIKYEDRVKVQGMLQRYTDTAISSTVNLPKGTTTEEIENLYYLSWKAGLKGITIYVDGSRDPILFTDPKKEEPEEIEVRRNDSPKRPKTLDADYYEITVKGQKHIVVVGMLGDHPYEVFEFMPNEDYEKVGKHKGSITKVKKGVYKFTSDRITIDNLSQENSDIEAASTKFISGLLRHGVATKYVIEITQKVNPNINSFLSAICRVLSNYTDENVEMEEKCPNCGGKLIKEVGCCHCTECEYSRCG